MMLRRHGPVLKPENGIRAIFNPAAAVQDGHIYLFPRVVTEARFDEYVSDIRRAESTDGRHFTLSEPIISPDKPYDRYGCEDARVTRLNGEYLITYTALSKPVHNGCTYSSALAFTRDFHNIRKCGLIFPEIPCNKDTAFFPELIGGRAAMLYRAEPDIQVLYLTPDELGHFDHELMKAYLQKPDEHVVLRRKYPWESLKIGPGPPPIKTEDGWLVIYHAVDDRRVYRAGAALLDIDNPKTVRARFSEPILEPEMDYERNGDVPNVVFPEGAVPAGNDLLVYYGAADKSCCLASADFRKFMEDLKAHSV